MASAVTRPQNRQSARRQEVGGRAPEELVGFLQKPYTLALIEDFRRLNAPELSGRVWAGEMFVDGLPVMTKQDQEKVAA